MRGTLEQHTPGAQGGIEPLVAMRGISKSFGENKVLRDVDFEFYSGEVHALLGENGAGKSTLMKILMGVYRPDQGRVYLDQVDITNQSIQGKMNRGISMIFQELSLLPNLTVAENIRSATSHDGRVGGSTFGSFASRHRSSSTPISFRFEPAKKSPDWALLNGKQSKSSSHSQAALAFSSWTNRHHHSPSERRISFSASFVR